MALVTSNLVEGAFDAAGPKWYVAMVYDDVPNRDGTFNIDHFEYANRASVSFFLILHDKQGHLVEETPGSGYTREVAPGTPVTPYPAGRNWDLAPDGSINGWTISARGPGR